MEHSPLSQAKIIATVGPAIQNDEMFADLFRAGVDVCRLNFSHGDYAIHKNTIEQIRRIAKEEGFHIAILVDLQGPKLRVGTMQNNGVPLTTGQAFSLVTTPCEGDSKKAYMSYLEFPQTVKIGDKILIDDGKLKLEVLSTNGKDEVKTIVLNSGILSSNKGVNLPNTRVNLPCLTEKDKADADLALSMGVDWLGLSFVRHPQDIIEIKNIIKERGQKNTTRVVAKIEKPEALEHLDEIIREADAIMVARGDLGVEISFEQIPLIQKKIIRRCVALAKPVIVATQMLESMITHFTPTRAEVNDVANAILDGADALMLSGETSVGNYPIQAVEAMQNIIKWTEIKGYRYKPKQKPQPEDEYFLSDSICYTVTKMASQVDAKAIVIFTDFRKTAMKIASFRPYTKILVFTTNPSLQVSLSLVWGIEVFVLPPLEKTSMAVSLANKIILERKLLNPSDVVIYTGHSPFTESGALNMLHVGCI